MVEICVVDGGVEKVPSEVDEELGEVGVIWGKTDALAGVEI